MHNNSHQASRAAEACEAGGALELRIVSAT